MIWALYLLACFGLSYIVGQSAISLPLRVLLGGAVAGTIDNPITIKPLFPGSKLICEMLECPACFGFWAGLYASLCDIPTPPQFAVPVWPLVLGCITSGSNLILAKLTRTME